jgi:hypothetical protein
VPSLLGRRILTSLPWVLQTCIASLGLSSIQVYLVVRFKAFLTSRWQSCYGRIFGGQCSSRCDGSSSIVSDHILFDPKGLLEQTLVVACGCPLPTAGATCSFELTDSVVGFKPSYGSVSRYGMIAYASSLDTASLFGHDVEDVEDLASDAFSTLFFTLKASCMAPTQKTAPALMFSPLRSSRSRL